VTHTAVKYARAPLVHVVRRKSAPCAICTALVVTRRDRMVVTSVSAHSDAVMATKDRSSSNVNMPTAMFDEQLNIDGNIKLLSIIIAIAEEQR